VHASDRALGRGGGVKVTFEYYTPFLSRSRKHTDPPRCFSATSPLQAGLSRRGRLVRRHWTLRRPKAVIQTAAPAPRPVSRVVGAHIPCESHLWVARAVPVRRLRPTDRTRGLCGGWWRRRRGQNLLRRTGKFPCGPRGLACCWPRLLLPVALCCAGLRTLLRWAVSREVKVVVRCSTRWAFSCRSCSGVLLAAMDRTCQGLMSNTAAHTILERVYPHRKGSGQGGAGAGCKLRVRASVA